MAQEEIKKVHEINDKFGDFDFVPRAMSEPCTPSAVLSILDDLGFIDKWSISRETLTRQVYSSILVHYIHYVRLEYYV